MKRLEPGCMALVVSGMCAGSVVTVVCHLPTGSQGTYKSTHLGEHYSVDYHCPIDGNWLVTGVNGMHYKGQLVEICEVTGAGAVGTAIFDAKNLMRLDDDSDVKGEHNPYVQIRQNTAEKKKPITPLIFSKFGPTRYLR